jgi:DNA-binding CsgD family transcriptional regulator
MLGDEDRARLLDALRTIGAAESVVDFAARVCEELLRLVPGISASYNEINLAAERVAVYVHPDPGRDGFDQNVAILEKYLRENPLVPYFEGGGESDVATWADVDPDGKFFETTLYREFYARNGVRSQLAFLLPAPPGIHVALAINRDGTDFDERERMLLSELRLHLVNLYRLVSHAEATRRRDVAIADDGWSVLLVDDDGTVLESNEVAVAIGRAAGVDLGVGARLQDGPIWSAMSVDPALDRWTRAGAPGAATAPFQVRLLRSRVGPHVLWIREPSQVTVGDAMALGLTERQAQIALMLVDGLTNDQIAHRLGIASGTVRKHLEAVFDRLGVSSRAAAVGRLRGGPGAGVGWSAQPA